MKRIPTPTCVWNFPQSPPNSTRWRPFTSKTILSVT